MNVTKPIQLSSVKFFYDLALKIIGQIDKHVTDSNLYSAYMQKCIYIYMYTCIDVYTSTFTFNWEKRLF